MIHHPWEQNADGLWCPCCGHHIATADQLRNAEYTPPDTCPECGFPEFEDGFDYFDDSEDEAR